MDKELNELQVILKRVKYATNKTIAQIAKEIDYSRPYLNDEVNKGENQDVKRKLLDYENKLLGKNYPENEHVSEISEPDKAHLKNVDKQHAEVTKQERLSEETIHRLVNANEMLAKSHLIFAESHKQLVNSNDRLSAMLQNATANDPGKSQQDGDAKLLLLLGAVSEIAAGKRYHSAEEAFASISRHVLADVPKTSHAKDIQHSSDRQSISKG